MEQQSNEWFHARCGKVTASRVADVVATLRNNQPAASRANYMAQLVAERLTGVPAESYVNAAMQWGIDTEPDARAAYEFYQDETVELVGFVDHPRIEMTGASPDGLVGDDGLVEIKCPNTATHIETLLGTTLDKKYRLQMQWQMACTGRQWCDYVSFDPRMPATMQLHVQRINRDDKEIGELESAIEKFLEELKSKVYTLRLHYEPDSLEAA